jgi:cytoskeletal protein CcmA (bactofilin family)
MRKLAIGLLATLTLVFTAAPAAMALDTREGNRITVAQNETVNDDMLLTGDTVVIDGTIDGDVFAFARMVTVNGTIKGNLITGGTTVEILGNVTGSVFGAGENVYVEGRVDRSLVAAGSWVELHEKGTVGRSLIAGADKLSLSGSVGRGAVIGASTATVAGKVGQEVKVGVGNLTLEPTAQVSGPLTYYSRNQATIKQGATTGTVSHQVPQEYNWPGNGSSWWFPFWTNALQFVGFVLVGLLFLTLFPNLRRSFPAVVLERPWQAPLAGFLALLAVPVALVVLLLTVVGIPLSLLSMALFPVAIYFGQVLVSWTVGNLLTQNVEAMRTWAWPLVFLTGAVLTTVAVHMPFFGGILGFVALLYGLGGVYHLILSARKQTAA